MENKVLISQRLIEIQKWLDEASSLSIDQLCDRFAVSKMTVWRDLKTLEDQDILIRVRGGVIKKENNHQSLREMRFIEKQAIHRVEKEAIARYAADNFVDDSDIIILEGGTTVAMMVPFLKQTNLTILTHALLTLNEAAHLINNHTIICCGGILREPSLTFVGPHAEAFFREFHANTFFLGGSGLSIESGITDINTLEIQVKRAMKSSATKTIALLDSSKFGKQSLLPILPLHDIDVLITDANADPEIIMSLKKVIPQVIQAQ